MTIFIKINEAESLNIGTIQSFTASEWEKPKAFVEAYVSEIAQRVQGDAERETVLTIVRNDGKQVTLCGPTADAALDILHLHGFCMSSKASRGR
jgi:hypothetical protein